MKKLNPAQGSITAVRAQLQQQSVETAEKLRRSVSRAASVDNFPCTEYGEEVALQHLLAEELLFLQHCRGALERAIEKGASRLVWRWQSGERCEVRFRRQNNHIRMDVRAVKAA
ncbi:MAG: hypothetical protein J6J83_03785 [Oscillospiraceae bacterium]|nr:hypothetical protein [Oscillospiraceae bacterium]